MMKKKEVRLGAVLLAAGSSARFGSNKLLCEVGGSPMVCRALEAMGHLPAARRAVVTGNAQIARLAQAYGCEVILNHAQQLGQSHSIALAVRAMQELDALLLLVGDQPLLTGGSLARLLDAFLTSPKGMACLQDETHRGNPAVFSSRYFDALLALEGDRGAKGILRAHEEDLLIVPCIREGELSDADTTEALEAICSRIRV